MVKGMGIALQLYSIRDEVLKNFDYALRQVKEMGYEGVEFAGLHGMSPEQIRKMADKNELTPVSAHVSFDELESDPEGCVEKYKEIGCRYIALPSLRGDRQPGKPQFDKTKAAVANIIKVCDRHGITLLYHNHNFEFAKASGEYLLDILYGDIPALQTEIDTCWVNVAGEDPAVYLSKYSGRAPVVHLKDFVMPQKKNFKKSEQENMAAGALQHADKFEFRPLGMGYQDIPDIINTAEKCGTKWLIVEQDEPSLGKTPLKCAKASIDYLKSIKFEG